MPFPSLISHTSKPHRNLELHCIEYVPLSARPRVSMTPVTRVSTFNTAKPQLKDVFQNLVGCLSRLHFCDALWESIRSHSPWPKMQYVAPQLLSKKAAHSALRHNLGVWATQEIKSIRVSGSRYNALKIILTNYMQIQQCMICKVTWIRYFFEIGSDRRAKLSFCCFLVVEGCNAQIIGAFVTL